MNIVIKGLLTASLVSLLHNACAQRAQLKLGDRLPSLVLNNVLNYSSSTINLKDLRGKYVIIDFWNHKCVACIKAFPKIDSLQKLYKEDLQIILVNNESQDSTERFFSIHKKIRMPGVPLITGDKVLRSVFPHEGYPYHVWIDRGGRIQNFSGGYNTTSEHVKEFVAGKKLPLFDGTSQTRVSGSLADADNSPFRFEFYSALAHCNRHIAIGSPQREIIDSGRLNRLAVNCSSVLNLIKLAFGEWGKYNFEAPYSFELRVKDSDKLVYPKDLNRYDKWVDSNSFSYEQWLPKARIDERFKMMQQDLQRYFGLDIRIEKRVVRSVVFSIADVSKLRRSKTNANPAVDDLVKLELGDTSLSVFRFFNQPFQRLADHVRSWFVYQHPFFQDSDYDDNIDLVFSKKSLVPLSFSVLREQLMNKGLCLKFEDREIPVLVIRDRS